MLYTIAQVSVMGNKKRILGNDPSPLTTYPCAVSEGKSMNHHHRRILSSRFRSVVQSRNLFSVVPAGTQKNVLFGEEADEDLRRQHNISTGSKLLVPENGMFLRRKIADRTENLEPPLFRGKIRKTDLTFPILSGISASPPALKF